MGVRLLAANRPERRCGLFCIWRTCSSPPGSPPPYWSISNTNPQAIFAASTANWMRFPDFRARHVVRMRDETLQVTERQWSWYERHGVLLVLRDQEEYPADLRDIPDPPPMLFCARQSHSGGFYELGDRGFLAMPPPTDAASRSGWRGSWQGWGSLLSAAGRWASTRRRIAGAASGGRTIAVLGCGLECGLSA